jgi:hypothetical protein
MFEIVALRELFDRWEQVWHEGRYDLVADCVNPNYIRQMKLEIELLHARFMRPNSPSCGRTGRMFVL